MVLLHHATPLCTNQRITDWTLCLPAPRAAYKVTNSLDTTDTRNIANSLCRYKVVKSFAIVGGQSPSVHGTPCVCVPCLIHDHGSATDKYSYAPWKVSLRWTLAVIAVGTWSDPSKRLIHNVCVYACHIVCMCVWPCYTHVMNILSVLICFIGRGSGRNEASSCPGIISSTLRFYYVATGGGMTYFVCLRSLGDTLSLNMHWQLPNTNVCKLSLFVYDSSKSLAWISPRWLAR